MVRKYWATASTSVALLTGLTLYCSPAQAFLPSANHILSRVAARRAASGIKSASFEGYLEKNGVRTPVWLGLRASGQSRLEVRGASQTQVSLVRGNQRWLFIKGQAAPPSERIRPDIWASFFAQNKKDPGGKRGRAALARLRIDGSKVSLARHQGRPAYIIGANPNEPQKPQLWIDKDLLIPVRLVTKSDSGVEEYHFNHGHGPITGPWYPEVTEHYQGGKLQSVLHLQKKYLNDSISAQLFEPPTP